ncbi:hypothetical protein PACTADRAFT_47572 [Pachysolen tannophilus NRRL Y-2460]|uniref:Smr domain-containing protein n=1 Tax=Pachysolen tannophilus NRRL Y-2460 TaxID=669874 RepID=A0A1E4U138_PACTA|nr:hypothetical protein PACTADRAFT_47572 [Pachysolen tannophilus NRRL Y-2460]
MSAGASTGFLDRGAFLSTHEKDYNHATDKEYHQFRKLADQAAHRRQELSHKSQNAYKAGDKSQAHELSLQAKKQAQIAEDYNAKAAEYVFVENNADSQSDQIDLHGLYVKEAEYILKQRIIAGINRHESKLEVIVGKGLHSVNGVAKLKPAIEKLCADAKLKTYIQKHNSGVLVIELSNANIPNNWINISSPTALGPGNTYQQQQQPQAHYNMNYQPQQNTYYQQQQQQQPSKKNGVLVELFLGLLCFCLKNR